MQTLKRLVAASLQKQADQVELSIDPRVQEIVDEELSALAQDAETRAAVAVVLDPRTGEILALGGRRGRESEPDLAARATYDPGSVMKVFSIGAALDRGVIGFDASVSGEKGAWVRDGETIRDSAPHGAMSVGDVLALSSNIGTAKLVEALPKEALADALAKLHFGERPKVELASASEGRLADLAHAPRALVTRIAYGADVAPSPLQVAAAFAAVAADGSYRSPTLVRVHDGAHPGEPVMRPRIARGLLELLEGVADRGDGTGRGARVAGHRVAGKTGTYELAGGTYANFVGAFPAEAPRFVMLVGIDTTARGYTGGTVAAPAFARIARKILKAAAGP